MYEGWRTISPGMAEDYARLVEVANEGARELGYADTGAMWRSGYDMDPDAFAAETDRLWAQVQPFYENLHCYVRARLNERTATRSSPPQARSAPIFWATCGPSSGATSMTWWRPPTCRNPPST